MLPVTFRSFLLAFIGIAGFLSLPLQGQQQFNMNNYLSQAINDIEMTVIQDQADILGSESFKSPILREVEIRSRTRQVFSEADDIRFRISPINPWERRANADHYDLLKDQIQVQKQVSLGKVLAQRYLTFLSYYFAFQSFETTSQKIEALRSIKDAYIRSAKSTKSIVDVEMDILKAQVQQEDLQMEINQIEYQIRSVYPFEGPLSIEGFQILPINQLINSERVQESKSIESNIHVLNEIRKADISFSEWNIRKHESFSNLGFIQSEYEFDQSGPLRNSLGFQFGIQLPIVNPDKPDLQRRKLELLESQNDVKVKEQEVNLRIHELLQKLENIIGKYDLMSERYQTFSNEIPTSAGDLDALIEIESAKLDIQFSLLELHHSALRTYILLLEEQGDITEPINLISAAQSPLDVDW